MTDEALYESLTQQIHELGGDGILVHDGDDEQYERVMALINEEYRCGHTFPGVGNTIHVCTKLKGHIGSHFAETIKRGGA